MKILKNVPFGKLPTIMITPEDEEWESAHKAWINGKNPTASPEWKKGVFYTISEYDFIFTRTFLKERR